MNLAAFLRVPHRAVPTSPDEELRPKEAMVNLARRSKDRKIVSDMVPSEGGQRIAGKAYSLRMAEFARKTWRPQVARTVSPSLERAMRALERLPARSP
jgi:hypothetical protein